MKIKKNKIIKTFLITLISFASLVNVKAEESRNGKVLTIYKNYGIDNKIVYSDFQNSTASKSEVVGKITCMTDSCKITSEKSSDTESEQAIFNNGYALVEENGKYVVYDYTTDTISYGPFGTVKEKFSFNDWEGKPTLYYGWDYYSSVNTPLYAVGYEEDGKYNIYSLLTKKEIKNIEGYIPWTMEGSGVSFNINEFVKDNVIVTRTNENPHKYTFISLLTGDTLAQITGGSIETVEYDNERYILFSTGNNSQKVYNSSFELMFDGTEIPGFYFNYNNLSKIGNKWIVRTGEQFKVYENNKLIKTSKKYKSVLSVTSYNNEFYALVEDGNNLNLINSLEEVIVTFSNSWKGNGSLENLSTLKIVDDKLSFDITNDSQSGEYSEFTYDFKTKTNITKVCPNDSNISIQLCISDGTTLETCIKKMCPGTEKISNPKTGLHLIVLSTILIGISIVSFILFKRKNYFIKVK